MIIKIVVFTGRRQSFQELEISREFWFYSVILRKELIQEGGEEILFVTVVIIGLGHWDLGSDCGPPGSSKYLPLPWYQLT